MTSAFDIVQFIFRAIENSAKIVSSIYYSQLKEIAIEMSWIVKIGNEYDVSVIVLRIESNFNFAWSEKTFVKWF